MGVFTAKAFGASYDWRVVPEEALSNYSLERLRDFYPQVSSQLQLQRLLSELSRIRPLKSAIVSRNGNELVIKIVVARPIGSIDVDSTSHDIEIAISNHLQRFVGLVPAPDIMAAIKKDTEHLLRDRGFYLAKVAMTQEASDNWTTINVKIDEDYPCRLRQVFTGFALPGAVSFDVKEGDICDQRKIDEAIEQLNQDLGEAGFNQRRILSPEFDFDQASNSALLVLPGNLGMKVTYQIESPVQIYLGDDLNHIDQTNADPDSMKAEIARNYQNAGYDDVWVSDPKKRAISEDTIQYVFEVKPGPQYIVSDILFQGVHHFQKEELYEVLGLDSLFATPLNHEVLRQGIENLQALYQQEGFWEVEIPYPRITKDSNTGVTKLVFVITEGKQRLLSEVIVRGNNVINNAKVQSLLPIGLEQPLPFSVLTAFEKDLEDLYRREGYLYANVNLDLIQNRDYRVVRTRLLVTISEGKRVKFGQISIQGLVTTQEEVVKRELRFAPGDWFDPELVEETRLALVKLGIFASVSVAVSDTSAISEKSDTLPFVVILREGKPGNVSFGPGFSIEDGARYVIESSYGNIAGTGRKVFFKGKISAERKQEQISNKSLLGRFVSIGYIEPYVLNLPVNGIASVSHKAQANQRVWTFTNGGEISLNHTIISGFSDSNISGFYARRLTRLETDVTEENSLIFIDDTRIGEIGGRLVIDDRDDVSWTTSGFRVSGEVAWAAHDLGGDIGYMRWQTKGSTFIELFADWTLALKLSFTSYENINRRGPNKVDVLPTSERLYAGGSDSNRGFRSRELGPYFEYWDYKTNSQAEKLIAGGSARSLFKFELRHKFEGHNFGLAAFLDSSNVFFSPRQEKLFRQGFDEQYANLPDVAAGEPQPSKSVLKENLPYNFEEALAKPSVLLDNHYVSYGLAFSIFTPIGPIDVSYGIPLSRCPKALKDCTYERGARGKNKLTSGAFHINIGSNF